MGAITLFTIAIIPLYLFLIVLVIRRYKGTPTQKNFIFLLLSSFFWVLNSNIETINLPLHIYRLLYHIDFGLAPIVAYFLVLFAIHFPNQNLKFSKRHKIYLLVPIVVTSVLGFSNLVIHVRGFRDIIFNYHFYVPYILVLVVYFLILGVGILVRKYLHAQGIVRLQLQYMVLGYLLSITLLLGVSIFAAFIRPLTHNEGILVNTFGVFFAMGSSLVIFRYRFLDIRVVIQKGLVQFFSFAILFGMYIYSILLTRKVIIAGGASEEVVLVASILLVGVTAEPLRRIIYKGVDTIISKRESVALDSLSRLDLVVQSSTQYTDLLRKIEIELSIVLPRYTVSTVQPDENGTFSSKSLQLTITPGSSVLKLLSSLREVIIIDELQYRVDMFTKEQIQYIESAQGFFQNYNIRAIFPLGDEGEVYAIGILQGVGSSALFKDQIDFLKKFHARANSALIQARMYKLALERAVRQASGS